MLNKLKQIIGVALAVALIVTMIPIQPVLADGDTNVDTGDISDSVSGDAAGKSYGYWSTPMGLRVSIYWAPAVEGAETYEDLAANFVNDPESVRQIGKAIDIVQGTNPYYGVVFYSNKSVFDYMKVKSTGTYLKIMDEVTSYSYVGTNSNKLFSKFNADNEIKASSSNNFGSFVSDMPSIKKATATEWETWFTGSTKIDEKTYSNISKLTEMCGQYVSKEDIVSGVYKQGSSEIEGVYKVFFEPLISVKFNVNRTGTFWTLRDAIKYGSLPSSKNNGRTIDWQVTHLGKMFEFLGNLVYLQNDEPCLNMIANKSGFQIDFTKQSHNDVVKALSKDGSAWNSLGVGCISPQRDNYSESVKVVTSYVQYKPQTDGTYILEECLPTETKQMAKSTVKKLLENDKVKIGVSGTGYLNDVFTSSVNLTKNSASENIVWEKGLPVNTETEKDITAKYVKSLNLGLKTRATFFAKNGILISKAATDDYSDTFTDLQSTLKEINGTTDDTELKDLKSEHFNCFTESSDILDFNASNANYSSIYIKTAIAKAFYEDMGISGDIDYMIDHATYIKDIDDIKLGSSKAYTVYIRYIVTNPPIQKSKVKIYKDGKYESTITLPDVAVKCYQDMDADGNLIYYIPAIKTAGTIDKDYKEATLVKWGTSTATMLEDMPSNPIHEGTTLTPKVNLVMGENVYVMFRLDIETPKDKTLEIPEWRLSKYDTDMDYLNNAFMSLDLRADAGHLAYASVISPSGTYNYNTINPNGKVATTSNTPDNMKYTDYLHSKAKTTGSYYVSHNNSNVAVKVAGTLNGIKSSDMSGIKLASWATSGSDKSKLAEYDLTTGTSSKLKSSADIKKTETLSYGIKNKNSYTHYYSIDNDYYVPGSDGGTPKDPSDDISGYWVCGCYLSTETTGVSYTTADYKVGITYHLYKAVSTDTLKVKATKTEENGKTTITQQNEDTLNIYPEVPMLFEDDNGKESIQFAAGTQSRKISLVDYHTLEYTAYVDANVDPSASATDSKSKAKAKSIGLGSLPVALKGSNLSVSFDVNKSESSNEQGILTVKSYALDIDNATLKSTWGNEDYNSKAAHTKLLDAFNNFSSGTATEQLDIAVPGGTNSAFTGPKVTNKLSYKLKDTDTVKHSLTVRGGVLTEVDGKTVASIKSNDKDLYNALVGMKLIGDKEYTVLKTLVNGEGDKLTESSFATQANKERGVSDIATGKGWYYEDTTILNLCVFTTTYSLPIAVFPDKIPMTVKGLETPIDKSKFFSQMSKGYNILNYTMTSANISGLGKVKVYFEHNSRTDSTFGANEPAYGISNITVNDSTFGGF